MSAVDLLAAALSGVIKAYCYIKPTNFSKVRRFDDLENFDPALDAAEVVWERHYVEPGLLGRIDPQLANGYVVIPLHILRAIEACGECEVSVGRGGEPNIGVEIDRSPMIAKADVFFLEGDILACATPAEIIEREHSAVADLGGGASAAEAEQQKSGVAHVNVQKALWSDVTIYLYANNRLGYSFESAPEIIKTKNMAELSGLINMKTNQLTNVGGFLVGLLRGKSLTPSSKLNPSAMKRLNNALKELTGLADNSFYGKQAGAGWVPRFKIVNREYAADERAKEKAVMVPEFMADTGSCEPEGASSWTEHPYEDENDAAADWLREN